MRRMREPSLKYLWALLPIVAIAAGSVFYLKQRARTAPLTASAPESNTAAQGSKGEKSVKVEKARASVRLEDDAQDAEGKNASFEKTAASEKIPSPPGSSAGTRIHDDEQAPLSFDSYDVLSGGERVRDQVCAPLEYRGHGVTQSRPTAEQWVQVMEAFHDIKAAYKQWLARNKNQFSADLARELGERVSETRIQRPPVMEELDLTWRGIGVWTQSGSDEPLIKLGNGFPRLFEKYPQRARFELARLLAQSWAPCELARKQIADPWGPLLGCLGVSGGAECDVGTYSEAAWALSSVVAAQVSSPGCVLPAQTVPAVAACFSKPPFREIAHAIHAPAAPSTPFIESPIQVRLAYPSRRESR